jgi:hypothetical protein
MRRLLRTSALTLGLAALLAGAGPALAQPYYPYSRPGANPYLRPTLSPYLNLLRGGDVAANYYLGTRQDFRQRAINVQLGTEIQSLERAVTTPLPGGRDDLVPMLKETGHPTAFGNYGGYYNFGNLPRQPQVGVPPRPPRSR